MSEISLYQAEPEVQRKFIAGVYLRMVLALAITAVTAYFVADSLHTVGGFASNFIRSNYSTIMIASCIAELAVVIILSSAIRKLTPVAAFFMFILYSFLTGVTFSSLLLAYRIDSIYKVFGISALMFLGMSFYAAKTKTDLRSAGRYLTMALIGIIIASLVNFLMKSEMLDWIISLVGVGVFVGLTAYDTQRIMNISVYNDGSENFQKFAIIGALELYLDFINLFLKMLRLFGKRR